MTDENRRIISPTAADALNFALTDARIGETDQEQAAKADILGKIYLDVLKRAQEPDNPNRPDDDCRAEAAYFSEALTGQKDVYGTLWRKDGFATGAEYLSYMKDFVRRSPEENKTQVLRDFEALDEKGQEDAAVEARKWTLENLGQKTGNAFGYVMDRFVRTDTTHRASDAEVAKAKYDMNEAAYRRKARADHYADLLADNAWIEISSILPRLSSDGRACTEALMKSSDNTLPETMYARFNNLPDEEKQMIVRARTVLKPRVRSGLANTAADAGIGLLNISTSILAGLPRFGQKLFALGAFDFIPGVDSDLFDMNEIARRRNYLWQATGRFLAGGEDGFMPQLQFEQVCNDHGLLAESVIGAVSTLGYMGAAALPGVGTALVAAEAMNEMDDHVVMQGGDITNPEYVASSVLFGGLYAYTERLQLEGLLGGVKDIEIREALLNGLFKGIVRKAPLRNMAVGTVSESVQEGLQNGIMSVNEAFALDQDATRAFADGFVQDFIGSLGTMLIVEAGGMVVGHVKRSGYNNPFTANGREAGREARSGDLEAEYNKYRCLDRMVEYAARSSEAKAMSDTIEAIRLVNAWENGGREALVADGVTPEMADEFDYFYRTMREGARRDEETGEEATDLRRDRAQLALAQYIADKSALAAKSDGAGDRAAFDAAMTNLKWVRDAWAQGAGVYRVDEEGNVQDPGARALERIGFTNEVAERLSRYFHYERANAYSQAALAGIKSRYETRMAGRVTAKAALAQQFGGQIVRYDGADYLSFQKDGTLSLVRIDETNGGIDFEKDDEGVAVSVENRTKKAERTTGKKKITKEEWLKMSPDERRAAWNERGFITEGSFVEEPSVRVTLPADPSVGIDSDQAATIIGTISMDANTAPGIINDTAAAFHEVFHAFSTFARTSGLWTKEDVAYLEKKFGKPKHSKETFDEEEGAEGFRSFLARRAAGAMTADDEHSPFMKIYAAAAGLDRVAKENAAKETIAERNETAFFQQLIADANRPKPKPTEKPDLPKTQAPQKGIMKKEPAETKPAASAEAPSPAPDTPTIRAAEAPGTWSAYTPTGNVKVSGHWAVLGLADVVHSNNPLYAVHMRNQLRNRKDNKAEEDTRKDIVNNFQPERLFDAPDTANGAPIVFYDKDDQGVTRAFVLSGNGRVLVLNELAERHLYDRYRNAMKQWAADRGIAVPEGQTPILVRVIDDYGGATRDKVADLSNTNSIQQYTEEEQARADAEVIKSLNLARLYRANADGSPDMTPGANDEFFSEFIRGVGDTSLYNSDRSLTQAARERAQRALLAISAGQGDRGRDVVKKLVEQTETLGIQKQKNAIMMMAAPVAALETNAAYAIGPDVSRAIADYMDYAEKHKAGKFSDFSKYLAQMDLLDAPSDISKDILSLLGGDKPAATIAEYVKAYCKAAGMEDPAGGLFGAARTRDEIWDDAKKLVESGAVQTPQTTQTSNVKPQAAPPPVLSVDAPKALSAPAAPPRGTVTHTVETKAGPVTAAIPSDPAREGLRDTYDPYVETPESPNPIRSIFSGVATRQNDPQGRYWGDKMPQFMGHKTEMFDRTVMTLRQKLSPEELAKFDTLVDYFGGGGCWGMSLALAAMKNVKRLVINEFDPARAKKIELLQTRGEKIAADVQKMFDEDGLMAEVKRLAATGADDGGETGSGSPIANIILRNIKPKIAGDAEKMGLMYAFTDCASRQLAGSRDVRDPKTGEVTKVKITFAERWQKVKDQLAKDGRNATAMRQAFEARGGTVEYVNGDATKDDFGVGFKTPHGGNVMSVLDPPYYRTEGYSDDGSSWKVGLEKAGVGYAYADTLDIVNRMVDSGDGLVYTDEAWWLKPEYLETHRVNADGLFDDASVIAASREFRREHEILGGIRNKIDHFDVAGKVARRYETLGVHHGGKKNGNDEKAGIDKGRDDTGDAHVGNDADGRGAKDDSSQSVRGLAGGAEGKDQPGLRSGGDSGQRSSVRAEDVVRDVYASIEDAAVDAKVGAISKSALEDLVRRSVRQVREDRQLAYANLVSENAVEYLKREAKRLDRYMAAHGYTEKVWHGTEGEDYTVFQLGDKSHGVKAAYFTYREETASNYATLRSLNVEDLEGLVKPNIRAFYVNPGKVLDLDESEKETTFQEFVEVVKKAASDGYNAIRVRNTFDDHGFRLGPGDSLDGYTTVGDAETGLRTDILIVLDQTGDPGANRIKAADPVTFADDTAGELPIPLEMRADKSMADVRYSVAMGRRAKEEARRVTPAEDAAYLDAVKRGDTETAARMVREAAAKAMPNTKVVDKDGLPLVVYHGTNNHFNSFDVGMIGKFDNGTKMDWSGEEPVKIKDDMFFFSSNRDVSKEHAKGAVSYDGGNARVVGVFINSKNPLIKEVDRFHAEKKYWDAQQWYDRNTAELQKEIEKNGNDALIVINPARDNDILVGTDNPYSIKSADPVTYDDAGNVIPLSERFNEKNDDIRYSIRTISEIDAQDGTDIESIGELIASAKPRGNKRGKQHYYKLSKTSDVVRDILPGEYFTIKSGTILNHAGKDRDHVITVEEWRNISEALHDPLVIAKYSFLGEDGIVHKPDNSYRVWVEATINGHYAMVGVDIKSPGRDISVNSVSTVYGDEFVSLNENDVVYSRGNGEGIRTLLGGPNPHEYSESPHTGNSVTYSVAEVNGDERHSIATAWKRDVKATCMTTRANIMAKHADLFAKAKAGDIEAAEDLVEAVVKPEKVAAIAKGLPKNTIIVPIRAEEATGDNKIPIAYATYLSDTTGLAYVDDIVQIVRTHHTGASAERRLTVNPEFDGAVEKGRSYLIVDDHITQGGTVNALRDHIESNGGKVVAVAALTLSQGSSILSPRKETVDEIKRKWPDIDKLLRTAGIADRVEGLTESQCRYIKKFSPDTFRNLCAKTAREGSVGALPQALVSPPSEAVGDETEERADIQTNSETSDERHSFFVGRAASNVAHNHEKFYEALKILFKEYDSTYSTKARNAVYERTGWWKGVDGMWRFEIDDLEPQTLGKTEGDTVNGLVPYVNLPYGRGGMCCMLPDICKAPQLFKAYPKLKNVKVRIKDLRREGITGSYDGNQNVIMLDTSRVVKDVNRKPTNVLNAQGVGTLTHEIQHIIQFMEGFATGGNDEDHGERNYPRLAGEVEARNVSVRAMTGRWSQPWNTEDTPRNRQIIADGYGNMRDYRGRKVERRSIRSADVESDARRAITSYAEAEGNKAANDALENYVAYFKLSHGSVPRERTLARIGLSIGMNVVDPRRILKNAERLAEEMRGTLVEQASKNGDVATAMALLKREKDLTKKLDDIIAGGVAAGGRLTHKGVGQINTLLGRRIESMMKGFTAATLADMEGDTGIDLASEILANNPDAFDTEYRKAKRASEAVDDDTDEGTAPSDTSGGMAIPETELSDADRYKRDKLMKEQAARVAKFIEDAKRRAEENGAKAAAARERRRVVELEGGEHEEGDNSAPETSPSAWKMEAPSAKANFRTPEEFAAFLRVWAADRFMKTHGLTTLGQAEKDKLFAEFYRICVRQELQDLADKLLAPQMVNANGETVTNPRLSKLGAGARVWVNRRIADIEKGIRPDTLERMSADIFAFINKAAVRVSRVDLITSFKDELKARFLKGAEFEELKADTERKLTGWVEEATRYIAYVCDLSRKGANGDPSQIENEYRKLHEIIDAREKVYDESGANVADAAQEDAETRKAQWKLALLDKYGAMRSLMPSKILDLQNAAFDYLENEAQKLEDAWKDTREQQDKIRRDFAGAIVGPGDQRYDAGKGVLGWLDKTLLDSMNGMIRLRLEHLTRFASTEAKEKAKDAINAVLVMLGDGEVAYAKALQADREAFFAGLGEIFKKPDGKADNRAIAKYLKRMDEPIPVELSRKLSNQGFAGSMTYGQMLQLLVSLEQRSFKDTVEANGREGQADLIRSFRFRNDKGEAVNAFTLEDDAFVQWLRSFYAAKRERLSEVTERMVGQKVDSPDPLYCPIRRFIDDKARSLHSDPTERWDPISKIFSRRVPSTRDFDESRSVLGLFFENSKESAKLTAWAERGSFIRNVVTSVPFQAAVKRAFGAGELGKILKQLEATFNGGEQRSQTPGEVVAADKAVNFVTYAYLSFNPLSALKQTTSFSVWANVLPNGFADLWRHMTHVDKSVIKHLMDSDEYKVRYGDKVGGGMDYATKGLNMNPSDNPAMRALRGAGMWMLKRGDFIPGAWIAQGVYKDLLDKHMKDGMAFDEADRLAITETFNMLEEGQQSARTYNTNMLQIEHGRIGRLLTQFATSPLQQLQYETQALREWRDMVRYQMGDDKVAEARAKFRRAVVINHVLIPAAMNLVIAMYKAALGEEPPWEKDGYHWTLLIDLLMGQFSRVFFLGSFAQTTLEALLKREYPRNNQMLPVEGAIGMAASGAFLVRDLATMDVEKLQKDLERAMKSTAPTRIPYNLVRRLTGDSDVDRKRRSRERR